MLSGKVEILNIECEYFDTYDPTLGLDWRYLFFQQLSQALVAITLIAKNSPFLIQLIYFVSAYIGWTNRQKMLEFKFKLSWWPFSLEMRNRPELVPKSRAFMLISAVSAVAFVIVDFV